MIINEIQTERDNQLKKWGSSDDDKWSIAEWAALLAHYATRQSVGNLHAIDAQKFRADVVKVGALAIACIEAIDRKVP